MSRQRRRLASILMTLVVIGVAAVAVAPYLLLDPAYSRVKLDPSSGLHFPLLLSHILSSAVALLLGPVQFSEPFRSKHLRAHRIIGRIYVGSVLIGGLTGIGVAYFTASYNRQIAFMTLDILWLFSGWKAYSSIRQRRLEAHRIWMIRNYAMTLVAVTGRVVVPMCLLIFFLLHGTENRSIDRVVSEVLEVNIWLGMALNLVLAEWVITRKYI